MRLTTGLVLSLAILLPHCATSNIPAPAGSAEERVATAAPEAQRGSAQNALASTPIPLDPAVRHGVLPNGLTYYVRANAKPEKRAELRLAVNAGSVLESEEQRGLAHFVEHMAFNGTERFKKQELVNYLERIGMRFGPDLNAYTSFDETVYMLQVPTDDAKIVDTGLRILRDWAGSISFEDEEIEKERGVVVEEWRLGRSAAGRISDKQVPVAFHGSRYAERLPIGKKEILEKAPPERLRAFYRDWYRPELMAIVAVGDFDPAQMEGWIREHFADLPQRPAAAQPRPEFDIPDHAETLTSVVTDPEASWISVEVDYKRPPVEQKTVADLRQSLIDRLYHSMMNDRLRELGRAADPPYQMAFAGSGPLGRSKSAYRLYARVNSGGVERALTTLLTEAKRVDRHGFAESELARARTAFLRDIDRLYEEREKQDSARFAADFVDHFLDEDSAPSIEWLRGRFHELIPGITLAEVNARAGQWITDANRVILVSGPEKKEAAIPDEAKLLAVFADAQKLEVTPWVDKVRDEPLVARAPAGGKVIEETSFADVGVTRWKISNGAVVLLKPTDFKNDEVVIRGWSDGGGSLAPEALHVTSLISAQAVTQMGAGNFDPTELGKALTGKVAQIGVTISETGEGVSGSASPKDLETAFQLLYLRFTGARKDEKTFASTISTLKGLLEQREAAPEYWFSKEMTKTLTMDHPRRRTITAGDVANVKIDDVLAFYRDRFADASDFTFTIVGSFEPAAIRPLVEKWIGGLPSTGRSETWRNVGVNEPEGVRRVRVEKGIEPRSSVRIVFHGDAKWSLDEAHQVSSLAEILRIRLREELREDRGGVYGVGVSGGLSRHPEEEYTFNINFTADPERVDELTKAVFDEIRKLKTEGPAEDYVNRVHEMQRRQREVALKQNNFWAGQLEYLATNDLEFAEIARYDQRVAAVTRESMRNAARRYLDETRYVIGVLDPEKK